MVSLRVLASIAFAGFATASWTVNVYTSSDCSGQAVTFTGTEFYNQQDVAAGSQSVTATVVADGSAYDYVLLSQNGGFGSALFGQGCTKASGLTSFQIV